MAMVAAKRMSIQDSKPVCSVCIANYNGEKVLRDCIESVLAQEGDVPLEIIIHDDASTDDSCAWIKREYPSNRFPQITLLESKDNVGFCVSNNRMVDRASGEYVLLLNNDAALAPDAIVTFMSEAALQAPQGILTLTEYNWVTNDLVDRGCFLDPFYNPIPNTSPGRADVAMAIGACLWIPRDLWHELGGFPDWFESIGEDIYLCCKARLWGYPVQVASDSYFRHRQGASFGGNLVNNNRLVTTYRRRRLSERNKTYVMILCSPPLRLVITLPVHLLFLVLEGVVISLMKRDIRPWKCIYSSVWGDLFRRMTQLRIERAHVQVGRSGKGYGRVFTFLPRKLVMLFRYGVPKIN
jgi:GT2 family glycosyltransferase